jgi:hypothetical protein
VGGEAQSASKCFASVNSSSNIAIIAGAVGGILALIIIPAAAFVVWKKRQTARAASASPAAEQPGSSFVPLPLRRTRPSPLLLWITMPVIPLFSPAVTTSGSLVEQRSVTGSVTRRPHLFCSFPYLHLQTVEFAVILHKTDS